MAAAAGAYHSTPRSSSPSMMISSCSQDSASKTSRSGAVPIATRTAMMSANTKYVTMASRNTPSGTTTNAVKSFEATVRPSDTGSDFQNRMLRSLAAPRQTVEQVVAQRRTA